MDSCIKEPKVTRDGKELQIVVHENVLPGPILCAEAHAHDYIEVLYCLSGNHEILLNRKKYDFSAGDMVIIHSMEIHQIRAVSDDTSRYIVVRFEPELLYTSYRNAFEFKYLLPFALSENSPRKVFRAKEIGDTFIPGIFADILEEYTKQEYCYEFAISTNICRIFLWVFRYWNEGGVTIHSSIDNNKLIEQFKPALEYINLNCSQDLTASFMADYCHMSYSYFSRSFKKIVNKSFREYLNYQRISKAEVLLATTDLSITDVAMQCGFSTSSYFIQQFKLIKKISPHQFRKKFI